MAEVGEDEEDLKERWGEREEGERDGEAEEVRLVRQEWWVWLEDESREWVDWCDGVDGWLVGRALVDAARIEAE